MQRGGQLLAVLRRLLATLATAAPKRFELVFVRHGQSEWNLSNTFTGWYDVKLSPLGIKEAHTAGKALLKEKFTFELVYTSTLSRAIETMEIILAEIRQPHVKVMRSWRLNERHYGNLIGLNKDAARKELGEEQVALYRRGYDTRPPLMETTNPYYAEVMDGRRYDLPNDKVPRAESLKDTLERTLPYWHDTMCPSLRAGKRVLCVAHNNTLRSILKHVLDITQDNIKYLSLPTGMPFVCAVNAQMKGTLAGIRCLGEPEKIKKAMQNFAKAVPTSGEIPNKKS